MYKLLIIIVSGVQNYVMYIEVYIFNMERYYIGNVVQTDNDAFEKFDSEFYSIFHITLTQKICHGIN